MSEVPTVPARGPDPQSAGRLESWKEIAAYLNREVRTVQRWEKNEGLPVRRHHHEKLGTVFAYKSELDAWWKQRQSVLESESDTQERTSSIVPAQAIEPVAAVSAGRHNRHWLTPGIGILVALLVIAAGTYVYVRLLPVTPAGKVRLVVRPFRNLTGDPTQEVFCEGLTETMETQLGQLDPEHLGVIADTTASIVKDKPIDQIRRQLAVDYVLEGSVFRAGRQVRIDAQLIRTSDQTHRWDDTYNREADDILSLQNEVAQDIANEIRLTLSPLQKARLSAAGKVDPDAYDAYLRGLVAWSTRTPSGLARSLDYFQQAIQKSPNFALAYAGLSNSYSILSAVPTAALRPLEVMPKAEQAAEEAIRLDPNSAEGQTALALVRQSYDYDLDGAERAYQRAFAINASYGTARHLHSVLLMARGRHEEALAEIEKARTLDPLSPVIPASRIQAFYFARQYDRAIEESRKALEVEPNFLQIHYHLGQSLLQNGRYAEALAELTKMQSLCGGRSFCTMAVGHAYAVSGERAKAIRALADLNAEAARGSYVPAIYRTAIYTGLGDKVQAMEWLEKAYQERTEYLIFLNVEPMADPLRSDPKFKELLRRVGLS